MSVGEIICIGCPLGCRMQVRVENNRVTEVSGNTCRKGDSYARQEVIAPTRTLTGTVRISGKAQATMLPCKTAKPVPKQKLFECMAELKEITVKPPVVMGEVIREDIGGTGVALVATKSVGTLEQK